MAQNFPRPPVKKALIVAIRYTCFKNVLDDLPLFTPHKDAISFRNLLIDKFGYEAQNIKVLADTRSRRVLRDMGLTEDDDCAPTRDNIINAMEGLVADAQPGDRFVFHFSGHGDQVTDVSGDEKDGLDEILYPSDILNPFCKEQVANYVLDDDIKRMLVDRLPPQSRLVMIFDCCHSGTAGDLAFQTRSTDFPVSPISPRPPSTKRLGISKSQSTDQVLFSIAHAHGSNAQDMDGRYVTSWSACQDNQITFEDGEKGSIFGRALNKALQEQPRQGHGQLLKSLRRQLQDMTDEANLIRKDQESEPFEAPLPQIGSIRRLDDDHMAEPFEL